MKNKLNIQKVFAIALMVFMSISAVISCNRDDDTPPAPKNELEEKGHDNWTKVEIIVREGHLHGASFHGNPYLLDIDLNDNVYFLPKEQIITFEQNAKGEVIKTRKDANVRVKGKDKDGQDIYEVYYVTRDPNHPIEVTTGQKLDNNGNPSGPRYSMEIVYYNGTERMNSQFITPEQIDYHQHFFTAKEYTNYKTGEVKRAKTYFGDELFEYTYRDTDPEDKMIASRNNTEGSKLSNNPVGFKGYFYFAQDKKNVKFDMDIMLAHLYASKYKNGKAAPANFPSKDIIINGTTDFTASIPFVIIGDVGEIGGSDIQETGKLDEADIFYKDLMEYYKIEDPIIVDDYLINKSRSVIDAESSRFWL